MADLEKFFDDLIIINLYIAVYCDELDNILV